MLPYFLFMNAMTPTKQATATAPTTRTVTNITGVCLLLKEVAVRVGATWMYLVPFVRGSVEEKMALRAYFQRKN